MTEPTWSLGPIRAYQGHALDVLRDLPSESVHCCVTSPPYYGLRDYGTARWEGGSPICEHGVDRWEGPKQTQGAQSGHSAGRNRLDRHQCECGAQRKEPTLWGTWRGALGLEPTPEMYVAHLVEVFREVRRVLRADGCLWLVLGDSFATRPVRQPIAENDIKTKDLIGIPWLTAFALRADGWYLRSDIVYSKANPMPESVHDRPTRAHEFIFLLAKSPHYYYDHAAVREPAVGANHHDLTGMGYTAPGQSPQQGNRKALHGPTYARHRSSVPGGQDLRTAPGAKRNLRSVWTLPTQPYKEAHFAVFPRKLVEPCILAGCPPGGTVLDPFAGSGTTLAVAQQLERTAIGIELNPQYLSLIARRVSGSPAPTVKPGIMAV